MIFWGPKWGDKHNKHYQTYAKIVNTEIKLFKKLAGSQYNYLLTQYYDQNGQIINDKNDLALQGATLDFTAPPGGIDQMGSLSLSYLRWSPLVSQSVC